MKKKQATRIVIPYIPSERPIMELTFYGACREVTGSSHLLTHNGSRVLLDCGLFQGKRKESQAKNAAFPFPPESITNLVLSHAHIDHSGRIPMLTSRGFSGRIIATRATRDACGFMLPDSAHIQESDADYLNYKAARAFLYGQITSRKSAKLLTNAETRKVRKLLKNDKDRINRKKIGEVVDRYNLPRISPLYTVKDAEAAMSQFEGYPYHERIEIGNGLHSTFYDAGHILGSAISILEGEKDGKRTVIGFTGDLGRFSVPILRDPTLVFPEEHRHLDLLIMESTYGNRIHEPAQDLKTRLENIIRKTYDRGGSVVIPSFAMERSQTLIYILHELYNEGKLPSIPVYVDSPLALNLTRVFGEHPECYDFETHKAFLENGENPFSFRQLHYVRSVEESMALNRNQSPHIVISASGMCESGRILHHLRYRIHNEKNTILFVGYQAENTLGRRIIEKHREFSAAGGDYPMLRFLNKEYPLKAEVAVIDGFSAHADQAEMMKFLTGSNLTVRRIALVHGEEVSMGEFSKFLNSRGFDTIIPRSGETVPLSGN